MFAFSPQLSLPFTDPVLVFALAMVIFLLAPLAVQRFNVPGIIGVIVAGAIVGPHGLNLLARGPTIVLLGTVGLIYLMFLAGVEIDLHGFQRYRWQSVWFGAVTFLLPQGLGLGAALLLGFSLPSAVLIGAMLASHTLLAYPLALSMGIAKNAAVTTAVGGTMIADTAALLVLAVVASATRGALDVAFWLRLLLSLGVFVAVILLGLPPLARWYFRRETTSTAATFVFVMTVLFAGAFFAELAGVEPIIGAFLVGLALNRLIPPQGLLINRVHFLGEAFLIPFFLLSVGMLVNVRVLLGGPRAWLVIATLVTLGILGKWLAAGLTARAFRYRPEERHTVFGLSVPRASATLAIALIGLEVGLFDEVIENGVVVLMMVTSFLGPWIVERHGRALALEEERTPLQPSTMPRRVLAPMSNPKTAPQLMDLALLLREERSTEPLYVLTVVPEDGTSADDYVANAEKMLSKAVAYASGAGAEVQAITRVDQNFASGILRAAVETRSTTVVIGWDGRTSRQWVFGSTLDQLLEQSTQQVLVAKLGHPLNTTKRLVVLIPRGSDHAPGFLDAVTTVKRLANRLGAQVLLLAVESEAEIYEPQIARVKPVVPTRARAARNWSATLGMLRGILEREDLVVVLGARRNTVSWHPFLQRLPARLAALVPESFLLLYPAERVEPGRSAGPDADLPRALARSRIVPDLSGQSAHSVLDALLERQYRADKGRRRDILRLLLHSQRGAALELTPGVVIAHARLDFLTTPQLFLGRTTDGVQFPGTERPAHLVFLLLSPTDQPAEHLAVLADVARFVAEPGRIERLRAADTIEAMAAALTREAA